MVGLLGIKVMVLTIHQLRSGYSLDLDRYLDDKELAKDAISILDGRSQVIVLMRLNGKTLKECASVFKFTKERVRRIEMKAYRKMLEHFEIKLGKGRLKWNSRRGCFQPQY